MAITVSKDEKSLQKYAESESICFIKIIRSKIISVQRQ